MQQLKMTPHADQYAHILTYFHYIFMQVHSDWTKSYFIGILKL